MKRTGEHFLEVLPISLRKAVSGTCQRFLTVMPRMNNADAGLKPGQRASSIESGRYFSRRNKERSAERNREVSALGIGRHNAECLISVCLALSDVMRLLWWSRSQSV